MPTLRNPTTGVVLEDVVEPVLLDYYRAEGWLELTEEAADLVADDPVGQFDPSEHNVDEVHTYLEGVDEVERARVLAAEAAGKARKSLLGDD